MPVARLLAIVTLFAMFAGFVQAQSQQNASSDLVVFEGAAAPNWSNAIVDPPAIQPQLDLESPQKLTQPGAKEPGGLERVDNDWKSPNRATASFPLSPESDRTCYFIRDYVVIRDSPQSDSTHRDGSFTCVPGSRFRVYKTGR
jgi:hypothetical protein